ncbi:MAG: dephospho-CoA kinase [Maribacter sp.]
MIKIGLTGGMGSGKSTVAQMFRDLGIPVYNSDERAKELMRTAKKIRKKIIDLLGESSYHGDELDRSYIAKKVFQDKPLLAKLNSIVHPAVRKDFLKWADTQESEYVLQETALLFENNAQKLYDRTILVTAPQELRLERLLKRDESSKEELLARMDNQLEDDAKIKLADFIIENIDLQKTLLKVGEVHHAILDSY